MKAPTFRRIAAALVAASFVVALVAFAGTREAGDGPAERINVSVATPAADASTAAGASGEGVGPGPDGGAGGAPTATPPPGARQESSILRIPNVALVVRAILAQAGGANSTFTYRAAVDARDAQQYALAAELFDVVVQDGGPLAPFAALRAAQMTALAGEPADAADRYASLLGGLTGGLTGEPPPAGGLAQRLPESLRAVALTEGARSLEAAGRDGEALLALEAVESLEVGTFTRAEALWERARILEAAGAPGWPSAAVEAMRTEPGSRGARDALDLLDEHEAEYPRLLAAYVAYRGFRNEDATARYEALIEEGVLDGAESAQAWFYLGALRERRFEREEALEAYERSIEASPSGVLADDARYWRGRVLEELGQPEEAAGEYDLLVEAFPASGFAEDARLRAAVALGLAGSGAESTRRLASITRSGSPSAAAEAAHWHAVLVALFDAPAVAIEAASAYDPTSYAAAFEASGAALVGPLPASALAETPVPVAEGRVAIDVWLAAEAGASRETASPVLGTPEVELAWILAEAGEPGVARGLLGEAVSSRREEPYELVGLAFEARERGLHDVALNAAAMILGRFDPATRLEAPRELLALAYPVPYRAETLAAAEEFGVPSLLLYALMRQESAFNPTAGSSAGAFGLTQVIEPTGEAIAAALGLDGWGFADLASPAVATRFGAFYLSEQLAAFDGHVLAALAAYNAGPGNAARWLESQPFEGPDGYLYTVDFTETRSYLERVTANYAMYRYVYAGAEAPRLPHGER